MTRFSPATLERIPPPPDDLRGGSRCEAALGAGEDGTSTFAADMERSTTLESGYGRRVVLQFRCV